jgi:drug/metabolite transporter (DMT)-like permease
VIIVLKTPDSPWPLPNQLSDWLALMGGFSFALTNILLKKLAGTPESARMIAMFGGGAVMAIATASLGMGIGLVNPPPAPALDWLWVAFGLTVAFLLGNLALQYGAAGLKL